MFTKIGVTLASGALPMLLWAGAASAQQSQSQSTTTLGQSQSQSQQSQSTVAVTPTTISNGVSGTGGSGTLARTGDNSLLPLAVGGVALGGAVIARRGLRRRSPA